MEDLSINTGNTPWFGGATALQKAILNLGPVVVMAFILLGYVLFNQSKKLDSISLKQDDALSFAEKNFDATNLGNHFQWASCVNSAEIILDKSDRQAALDRCIPPPEKAKDTSYQSIGNSIAKSDSSAFHFVDPVNSRDAESIAETERQKHLDAIKDFTTITQ